MHEYHLDFCQAAQSESFEFKKLDPKDLEEYIYYLFKRDFELQVKNGRMRKIEENCYGLTFRGVIVSVPMQALYFLYNNLFKFYRPKQTALIERMKKKLAKIRQE